MVFLDTAAQSRKRGAVLLQYFDVCDSLKKTTYFPIMKEVEKSDDGGTGSTIIVAGMLSVGLCIVGRLLYSRRQPLYR